MRRDGYDLCISMVKEAADRECGELDKCEEDMVRLRDRIHDLASPITKAQLRSSLALERRGKS